MAITWLHISDLHRGQPGDTRWDHARAVVLADIKEQIDKLGEPDLVLFTGDLAYAGKSSDYIKVDETLDDLYSCIGHQAVLVSVPGNHDLARPDPNALATRACKQYFADDQIRRSFVTGHKPTVAFFRGLFAEYEQWWRQRVISSWQARRLRFKEGLQTDRRDA